MFSSTKLKRIITFLFLHWGDFLNYSVNLLSFYFTRMSFLPRVMLSSFPFSSTPAPPQRELVKSPAAPCVSTPTPLADASRLVPLPGRRAAPESKGSARRMAAARAMAVCAALLLTVLSRPLATAAYFSEERQPSESPLQSPTVLIAIIARNSAHTLPYYLGALERLDYPKDRISIWAATDHNIDNTTAILREWLTSVQRFYHYVEWRPMDEPRSYPNELGPKHWTQTRFEYMMKLKQAALKSARKQWADYILGYYRRTAEYFPTRNRQRLGCFAVPMVHSTFLIDLRKEAAQNLAFYPPHPDYSWAFDDIIVFAFSCRASEVQMYVCNKERYGFINIPGKPQSTLEDDNLNFIHLMLDAMIYGPPMLPSQFTYLPPRYPDKMNFDEVYLINLKRRPDRRKRMLQALYEQEIDSKIIDAVDGSALNSSTLKAMGISMLPGYYDPYSGRTLTKGEIGCFLSHYSIWKEVVDRKLNTAVVFEDDVRFEGHFKRKLKRLLNEIENVNLEWDLIYLGRKLVNPNQEEAVPNVRNLVVVEYSYWTLAYVISQQGAEKLVNSQPLSKMLPVDEFLPIMYDKHTNEEYKKVYPKRDLLAFSVHPLLVFPTHYTGDPGWFSDTETSTIWDDDLVKTDWSGSQKTVKASQAGASRQSIGSASRDEL
ncbi:procollagen galactosyltransferase 1 isoform X2 [Pristis pectinata]|uniref:procollagen galactosyltransferase 1 isoform X2 n=1 Tax=Pristis pectinata TaxID=685728 RepID=UPI00223DFE9F|nr:procollagen galactosyltransferase 1 isoform X2 [Pristis pectinata]